MPRAACVIALIGCSGPDTTPPAPPKKPSPIALMPAMVSTEEVWLKGTTHVHAAPSGDSNEPVAQVVQWYEQHHYDFIVITDHNRVTPASGARSMIVIPGIELTHNRKDCDPPGDESGNCRIHVNALGVTAKLDGKLEWSDYKDRNRIALYTKAFAKAHELGASVIQINHPQYYWGMTTDVMNAIGKHAELVEIANQQFAKWNAGDATHASTEALWDAALAQGLTLWGVASDDAHDYQTDGGGKYPAGGGWVMVKARRDRLAILAALAAGRFYSSTGVLLSRAERVGDELVVEVAPGTSNQYTIAFIENGKTVATVNGLEAKHAVPRTGYVRAVITRDDGKQAWVQPVRP
ncbi:MAG TPA: CehA/McbA family metallohydrolase [Kofleriaceae bacterium]